MKGNWKMKDAIISWKKRSLMMLLKIIKLYIPGFIKKKKMLELFRLTADAFQCEPPDLRRLTFARILSEYALFTKVQAEGYFQSSLPLDELKQRLYKNSYTYGQNLKKSFHIASREEAVAMLEVIYKLIEIDFKYEQDKFIIKRCFFSKYYSKEACKLLSSLDNGLAAGLLGGRLRFYQRIPEGCSCCKGYLKGGFLK
ncbi:hypothetical protein [Acetivibrio cellulolyticus]|uniref:hypothetical protein n=1 Tax=Acetivibrio cellulolyticus TaxID=35830 RepID=UPI0001E2CC5B|nr:hypothetical protein [Acetivibrio cellulolyticus]